MGMGKTDDYTEKEAQARFEAALQRAEHTAQAAKGKEGAEKETPAKAGVKS
jgi:hypothetical protein